MSGAPLGPVRFHCGDALAADDYPRATFHVVVSTGLGDFLDDAELEAFYAQIHRVLEPGGTFYTSASARDRRSDALLRMVELLPCYRTAGQIEQMFRRLPWRDVRVETDATGLQAFITAVK